MNQTKSKIKFFRNWTLVFISVSIILINGCSSETKNAESKETEAHVIKSSDNTTEAKQVWTSLEEMAIKRCSPGMVAINGEIYAIGGWNLQNGLNMLGNVEVFDPDSGKWEAKASMTEKRLNFGIAVLNGEIYTIGGGVKNPGAVNPFMGSEIVEKYDPESDSWSKTANLSCAASYVGAATVDGNIYAIHVRALKYVTIIINVPDSTIMQIRYNIKKQPHERIMRLFYSVRSNLSMSVL